MDLIDVLFWIDMLLILVYIVIYVYYRQRKGSRVNVFVTRYSIHKWLIGIIQILSFFVVISSLLKSDAEAPYRNKALIATIVLIISALTFIVKPKFGEVAILETKFGNGASTAALYDPMQSTRVPAAPFGSGLSTSRNGNGSTLQRPGNGNGSTVNISASGLGYVSPPADFYGSIQSTPVPPPGSIERTPILG